MDKKIELASFGNDPNIGLHAYITKDYAIVNPTLKKSDYQLIKEVLDVDIIKTTIGEVNLVGVMVNGLENKIIVPHIALEKEIKLLEDHNFEIGVLESPLTALGNNLLIGKTGIIANKEYNQKTCEALAEFFNLKLQKMKLAQMLVPGSLGTFINNKLVIGNIISPEEKEFLEDFFDIEVFPTTVNFGSPFIKAGILKNEKGLLIGKASGTAEIVYLDEIFNQG